MELIDRVQMRYVRLLYNTTAAVRRAMLAFGAPESGGRTTDASDAERDMALEVLLTWIRAVEEFLMLEPRQRTRQAQGDLQSGSETPWWVHEAGQLPVSYLYGVMDARMRMAGMVSMGAKMLVGLAGKKGEGGQLMHLQSHSLVGTRDFCCGLSRTKCIPTALPARLWN